MTRSTFVPSLAPLMDTALGGMLLVILFLVQNVDPDFTGFGKFLMARVTIPHALLGAAFILIYHLAFEFTGVYGPNSGSFRAEVRNRLAAVSLASLFVPLFPALSTSGAFTWTLVPCFWAACSAGTVALAAFRHSMKKRPPDILSEVLIVGSGPLALQLWRGLQMARDSRVIGFVDTPVGHRIPDEIKKSLIGTLDSLDRVLMTRVVDRVIIALPIKSCYDQIQKTIAICEQEGVQCEFQPRFFERSLARPTYELAHEQPTVRLDVVQHDYRLDLKRAMDVIGAVSGLLLLAPVMLAITVVIKLTSAGPVLFTQQRFGLNKRRFAMLKFRTMVVNAEALQPALETRNEANGPVFKIHRDPRATRVGAFLRKTSLDELPQLVNVLRGEMSLVGPRPLPVRDVARFDAPYLMRRFSVKPGLTCLWQISGRSNTTFQDWIQKDLHYIDNWSLTLDLAILAKTFPAVVKGTGAV
jgi:exopolysaccharide biosynthesis polyprenyl glycosylphosphotransferase